MRYFLLPLLLLSLGCIDVVDAPQDKEVVVDPLSRPIAKQAYAAAQNRDRIAAELGLQLAAEIEASDATQTYDGVLMRRLTEINDRANKEAFAEVTASIAPILNHGQKLDKKKAAQVIRDFYTGRQQAALPLPQE